MKKRVFMIVFLIGICICFFYFLKTTEGPVVVSEPVLKPVLEGEVSVLSEPTAILEEEMEMQSPEVAEHDMPIGM